MQDPLIKGAARVLFTPPLVKPAVSLCHDITPMNEPEHVHVFPSAQTSKSRAPRAESSANTRVWILGFGEGGGRRGESGAFHWSAKRSQVRVAEACLTGLLCSTRQATVPRQQLKAGPFHP